MCPSTEPIPRGPKSPREQLRMLPTLPERVDGAVIQPPPRAVIPPLGADELGGHAQRLASDDAPGLIPDRVSGTGDIRSPGLPRRRGDETGDDEHPPRLERGEIGHLPERLG